MELVGCIKRISYDIFNLLLTKINKITENENRFFLLEISRINVYFSKLYTLVYQNHLYHQLMYRIEM